MAIRRTQDGRLVADTLPTADATRRGMVVRVPHGDGDALVSCLMDADGAYAWSRLNGSGVVYARDYDTLADALAAAAGKTLALGGGTYPGLSNLQPASYTRIVGEGETELLSPASPTAPIFDLDGVTGVTIEGVRMDVPSGTASSRGYGIWIHGNAGDILVRDVRGDGFASTVQVGYGPTGTSDGLVHRVDLERVTALNSPALFGICVDDVETITLDRCYARGNWLDGIKLRKLVKYWTITGGEFAENGVSGFGDGMDAYAGGDTGIIRGAIFRANGGSGLTIKQGDATDPADFGYVKNIIIEAAQFLDNTAGSGLYMPPSPDTSIPIVATVAVTGCLAEGNQGTAGYGFYNGSRNVTYTNCIAKKNGRHGFVDSTRAIDSVYHACRAIANGQETAGIYDGFNLAGHGGEIVGCRAIGVDDDDVGIEGDYAALTKYHNWGIRVTGTATGKWRMSNCRSTYHAASGTGLRTDMTSGVSLIDQDTEGNPGTVGAYGSVGSRVVNTSAASATDTLWVKSSGQPNQATTGWSRVVGGTP